MPDGKGGLKAYQSQQQYELVIGKANRDRFAEIIGFAHSEKQAKLEAFMDSKNRGSDREQFRDMVEKIENAGTADVYDMAQPQTYSLIANGLVVHNCGEQFLGPFENCCLGSKSGAPSTQNGALTGSSCATSNVYTLPGRRSERQQLRARRAAAGPGRHRVRRIGLGIMGLADLMYKLGVRYGCEEGQEFAGQIIEFVRSLHETSIELARSAARSRLSRAASTIPTI